MKKVYPVVFTPDNEQFLVYVPDFDIYTQGMDLADAIDMARDAINLMGVTLEDDEKVIPDSSNIKSIHLENEQICTLVDCDFDAYRRTLENKSVKKNCTIPSWLNEKAEAAHINFSAVLQEALKTKLNLS